jgi:hypothetical protein
MDNSLLDIPYIAEIFWKSPYIGVIKTITITSCWRMHLIRRLNQQDQNPDLTSEPGQEIDGQNEQQNVIYQKYVWLIRVLRDPAWQGIGTLLTLATFLLAIWISYLVTSWSISQERAHLFVSSPTWYVSCDWSEWTISINIVNDGPATANDLNVDIRISESLPITLTNISVFHSGEHFEAILRPEKPVPIHWSALMEGNFKDYELNFSDYRVYIDRLLVGNEITIHANFITEPSLGEEIHRSLGVSTEEITGMDRSNRADLGINLTVNNIRTFFVYEINILGDKINTNYSNNWNPKRIR